MPRSPSSLSHPFFGRRVPLLKCTTEKSWYQLILASLLEDLGVLLWTWFDGKKRELAVRGILSKGPAGKPDLMRRSEPLLAR